MYALAPREVMLSKHKSAIVLVVEIERYQKNGSVTMSGNTVKIRVYFSNDPEGKAVKNAQEEEEEEEEKKENDDDED
ncbi:hypothetical protein LTR40_012017, partial [Exophiala xenobiotica]